jgi:hypothetical protein
MAISAQVVIKISLIRRGEGEEERERRRGEERQREEELFRFLS